MDEFSCNQNKNSTNEYAQDKSLPTGCPSCGISKNHNENETTQHGYATDPKKEPPQLPRLIKVLKKYKITDWIMVIATCFIAIATVVYTCFSIKQWQAMEKQTALANENICIAQQALKDARESGIEQSTQANRLITVSQENAQAAIRSANAAQKSADIARTALVVSNRAWIKLDGPPEITHPLKFDRMGQGQTYIQFRINNIGHSPAQNVRIHAACIADISLYMQQGIEDPRNHPDCRKLRERVQNFGNTVFPGQPTLLDISFPLVIQRQVVDNDRNKRNPKRITDADYMAKITPIIFGCIDYVLPEDGSHRQTTFVYRLGRRSPDSGRISSLIDTRIPVTPIDQLLLLDYFGGKVFTD